MVKERKLHYFKMKFRSRKKPTSITIPSKSIRFGDNGGVVMFPTYIDDKIKMTKRL